MDRNFGETTISHASQVPRQVGSVLENVPPVYCREDEVCCGLEGIASLDDELFAQLLIMLLLHVVFEQRPAHKVAKSLIQVIPKG